MVVAFVMLVEIRRNTEKDVWSDESIRHGHYLFVGCCAAVIFAATDTAADDYYKDGGGITLNL